ncbi:hypothetical protein [Leptolyngbya sp. PCC 6406]|uniref:hypothetical protein n=1 Tax=Leptolyngbya sp. PCC 6406 TaxID=1173264 RepID=UPI0002AB9F53|nr:hypothetical protein [Leptolyngbya sp. PCC 6406]
MLTKTPNVHSELRQPHALGLSLPPPLANALSGLLHLRWTDLQAAMAGQGPDLETILTQLPTPPRWLLRAAQRLRIGFALAVILSIALASFGCSAQASAPWRVATQLVPAPLLEEVMAAETSLTGDQAQAVQEDMLAWSIPGKQGRLVLLNYNSDLLCGSAGCLYSGLWLEGDTPVGAGLVLSTYLRPELPPDTPLIQPIDLEDGVTRPLPCLAINQLDDDHMQALTLCLRGERYQVASDRRLPLETGSSP